MVLEAADVTVEAGRARLIEHVSLQLHPGQFTVILGANGAGKSTLLGVLAGDLRPSKGEARLEGAALASIPPRSLAARRAVVLQHAPMNFALRVHEVVSLSRSAGAGAGSVADDIEERALKALNLAALADRDYSTLSGGERQRVQIARALAQLWHHGTVERPGYLLMDEPTAHLDLKQQFVALEAVREFVDAGGAALCILHDLRLASEFADETVLMQRGRIIDRIGDGVALEAAQIADLFEIRQDQAQRLLA